MTDADFERGLATGVFPIESNLEDWLYVGATARRAEDD